jgi:REP element-mobilizing transposase RayT
MISTALIKFMKYDPQKHHGRSIRLKGHDYTSPGAYFITICTHQRQCLFGEIIDGEMQLNEFGKWVDACWKRLPTHFPHLQLDRFVVMPNHIHGILTLTPNPNEPPPIPPVGAWHSARNLCMYRQGLPECRALTPRSSHRQPFKHPSPYIPLAFSNTPKVGEWRSLVCVHSSRVGVCLSRLKGLLS